MPGLSPFENNIVDPQNSSNVLLGAMGSFIGPWVNVTDYTSITALMVADQIVISARFEWSEDAVNVRDDSPFLVNSNPVSFGGGLRTSVSIPTQYYRIVVENGSTPQSIFVLNSMLRRGTPSGFISPIIMAPVAADDALTVKSVLFGTSPGGFVPILTDGNGILEVTRPPNPTGADRTIITASIGTSQRLDPGTFTAQRKDFFLFNDTITGNLYIKLGADASLTDFDFKVPSQHSWVVPHDWVMWGDSINGIWDTADGVARCMEEL